MSGDVRGLMGPVHSGQVTWGILPASPPVLPLGDHLFPFFRATYGIAFKVQCSAFELFWLIDHHKGVFLPSFELLQHSHSSTRVAENHGALLPSALLKVVGVLLAYPC